MRIRTLFLTLVSAVLLCFLASAQSTAPQTDAIRAEDVSTNAELSGVTRNLFAVPMARTTVTVRKLDEGGDRTTVSGPDGAFVLPDLAPGHYQLTGSKEGLANAPPPTADLGLGPRGEQEHAGQSG